MSGAQQVLNTCSQKWNLESDILFQPANPNVMTHLPVAIIYELICTKKILDFVFISKLSQIQSCHSIDITPHCNWRGFMVGEKVVMVVVVLGGLRAPGPHAQLNSLSRRTQEWISVYICTDYKLYFHFSIILFWWEVYLKFSFHMN